MPVFFIFCVIFIIPCTVIGQGESFDNFIDWYQE